MYISKYQISLTFMFPRSHIHHTHELKQQNGTFMIIGMDNEGFTINNFTKRNIFNNPHLQNVKANITVNRSMVRIKTVTNRILIKICKVW